MNRKKPFGGLGFGIERVGLVAVRAPAITLTIMLIVTALALVGAFRLQTGGLLIGLLRSNTPEYKTFERLREEFSATDSAILVVVSGQNLLDREQIERLRSLHVELQLSDAVASVLSVFSIADAPQPDGYAPPLFPDDLPEGAAFDALKAKVLAHPLVRERLFVETKRGRQATLLIVTLKPEANEHDKQADSVRAIEAQIQEALGPAGLSFRLFGAPPGEVEIREHANFDRLLFNVLGLLVGILVCLLYFRRIRPVAIVTAAPVAALAWTLGMFGWFDVKVSTLLNAVLPLVIVITYCDAMHVVAAIRRELRAGNTRKEAAHKAIMSVGPACVLTSLTTALAMASLLYTSSEVVETFGWSAALATIMALFAVLLLVPALSVLFLTAETPVSAPAAGQALGMEILLERICGWLAGVVERHARLITICAAIVTLALTAVHIQLQPTFRMGDQAPDRMRAELDATAEFGALALAYPIEIIVRPPSGMTHASPETRDFVKSVVSALEAQPEVQKVWSIELLRGWLEQSGASAETIDAFLNKMPPDLKRRFLQEKTGALLVTAYLPDLTANETLRILAQVRRSLAATAVRHPGFEIVITGLASLSAEHSTRVIAQLNFGMFTAIVLVLVLMGIAFRSAAVPVYSLVPNFIPLVAAGTALAVMGKGLDYASIIALIVAFGIAVDNAIHILSRLRHEVGPDGVTSAAVAATMQKVGPVLIATTTVLVVGMAATVFSALPPTRTFGALSMITLAVALVADLLVLPAIILAWRNLRTEGSHASADRSHVGSAR